MFDNLREPANNSAFDSTPFYEDEAQFEEAQRRPAPPTPRRRIASPNGRLLGMTPPQRFVLAVMLLLALCTLSAMCLLVTEKISLF